MVTFKSDKEIHAITPQSAAITLQSAESQGSLESFGSKKSCIERNTWTRREVHEDFEEDWERAGGTKKRKVVRILDRDAAEFQSRGRPKVRRSNMATILWLSDPFHTLLSLGMHRILWLVFGVYLSLWFIFAGAWLAISKTADCGVTLTTYRQAFYLSLETLTTIGYGVDDQYFQDCPEAAPVLAIGSICTILMATAVLGMFLLRFGLSRRRTRTLLFSDMALLQVVGEKVRFTCRVFGMHRQPILQTSLQVYAVQHRYVLPPGASTKDPRLQVDVQPLAVEAPDMDSTNGLIFLGLPTTISHYIDASSPLAPPGLDRDPTMEEVKSHFKEHPFVEVILMLGGTVEHTGNIAEKRHSYTLDDIFWHREFVKCMTLTKDGTHNVDFNAFHKTRPRQVPSKLLTPDVRNGEAEEVQRSTRMEI